MDTFIRTDFSGSREGVEKGTKMHTIYYVITPDNLIIEKTAAITRILAKRIFLLMTEGQHANAMVEIAWRQKKRDGFKMGVSPTLFD